jgi:hypothetical protein
MEVGNTLQQGQGTLLPYPLWQDYFRSVLADQQSWSAPSCGHFPATSSLENRTQSQTGNLLESSLELAR